GPLEAAHMDDDRCGLGNLSEPRFLFRRRRRMNRRREEPDCESNGRQPPRYSPSHGAFLLLGNGVLDQLPPAGTFNGQDIVTGSIPCSGTLVSRHGADRCKTSAVMLPAALANVHLEREAVRDSSK